jgi:hypothetical protein
MACPTDETSKTSDGADYIARKSKSDTVPDAFCTLAVSIGGEWSGLATLIVEASPPSLYAGAQARYSSGNPEMNVTHSKFSRTSTSRTDPFKF